MTIAELPDKLQPKKDIGRNLSRSLAIIITAAFVITLALFVYHRGHELADEEGWIEHKTEMRLMFGRDNWNTGEFRNCATYPHETKMDCDATAGVPGTATRIVPVKFHGRINRTDHPFFTWMCRRNGESLTCWAVD